MYMKPISEIPITNGRNTKPNNNQLKSLISEFYYSDNNCVEVIPDPDEYASNYSLYSGLRKAIEVLQLPVEAEMRRGAIYLRKS